MKRIVVLTGSELRHRFVRKALALSPGIEVVRSNCEGLQNTLVDIVQNRAEEESALQRRHLDARARSEEDFFGVFDRTGPIGLVLMCGALASLMAQWGLIPMLKLGPRSSTLWGMGLALVGILVFAVSITVHVMGLGMAIASLGFGLYRPGFTAGASPQHQR